jgi:hypothetical protein
VVSQVLEWSLSGHNGLDKESEHGEHGKTSVLDLLNLELGEGVWVVSESEWVESLTWVEGIESLTSWSSVDTVSLNESHKENLGEGDSDNRLGVDQGWVSEVVESIISEDGGSSLEPDTAIGKVGRSVVGEELWGDASKSSKHSPTSVDDLSLPVLGESLWVRGETSRVPSVVAWVLSSQVRDLWGEWSEVLNSVWSVELDGGLGGNAGSLN